MKIINHIEDNEVCFGALEDGDMFIYPSNPNNYYVKMLDIRDKLGNTFNSFNLNDNRCAIFSSNTGVIKVKGTLHIENI